MKLNPTVAFDEASSESPSVAGSTPPLPPDTCVETQSHQGSHSSQKPTPRTHNLKKAFNGKFSSTASLSSHQRKPNFLSGSNKRSESNTSSTKSGDMIKARTSSAHAKSLEKNKGKVPRSSTSLSSSPSRAKVANRRAEGTSTHQSLVFSSGVYEGEKRHGKPHGKGTFSMSGQFSYTGDWAMGNPSGSGFFKLANGEIREGSWDGTNFIEHRRFMAQSPKPKAISIPKKNEDYTEEPINKVNKSAQMSSSSTASPSPSFSGFDHQPLVSSPRPADLVEKESTLSGTGSFLLECAPYLAKLKIIAKPNASKSGSLRTQGETIVATMTYNDVGGKYDGEWKGGITDGLPNGMGSFQWNDGAHYYGEWTDGIPSGDGRFSLADGKHYSRKDHNDTLTPSQEPNTPATEASSQPPDAHHESSPTSTVTMSPVLVKSLQQRMPPTIDNEGGIDIPPLGDTNEADRLTFGELSSIESKPIGADVDANVQEEEESVSSFPMRLSSLLPYKRGPSIPNITSFTPKEEVTEEDNADAIEEKEEEKGNSGNEMNETDELSPLVFVDDRSASSVHSPCRGGLEALIQEKVDEDPEAVRHILEAIVVLRLDETRLDVKKFLGTKAGRTTSAAYFYPEVGTYNGEFCDGYPHGVGTFFWLDGTHYSGNWDEGEPDGDGKLAFASGEMFIRCAENNEIIHLPPHDYATDAETRYEARRSELADEPPQSELKEQKHTDLILSPGGSSTRLATGDKAEKVPSSNSSAMSSASRKVTVEHASIKQSGDSTLHESPRRKEDPSTSFYENSPRANRVGGVTHLDSASVGDMSGIDSMIADIMEMSVFSEMEDVSVFSQLSGVPREQTKKKKKVSLKKPKLTDLEEASASQASMSHSGTSQGSSIPIDVDEASFYESDDDEDAESRATSNASRSQMVQSSGNDCVYYNGFPSKCRPYLSSLRCVRFISTKKAGSLHFDHGKNMAGVTYADIGGEYDGEWRGSMVKGKPHGFGQFNWADGTRYIGNWNLGVPSGEGEFVFIDGSVCKRGKGIVVVQAIARGYLMRQSVSKQQIAASTIQDAWKNRITPEQKDAVTAIQRAWRKYYAVRGEVTNRSASLIQEKYRVHMLRKNSAATLIQIKYRAYIMTKVLAANVIQRNVRSKNARIFYSRQRSSAVAIQAHARRHAARSSFLKLVRACTILQARTKGIRLRKVMEARYIDIDALNDDDSIGGKNESAPQDNVQEGGSGGKEENEEEAKLLAAMAQVYPPECAPYILSFKASSKNRKGSLYWNDVGKHAALTYTSIPAKYNGGWRGNLVDGSPHGNGKVKFQDRTKFYGSFVNGVPKGNGYFKFTDGRLVYSKYMEQVRQSMLQELTGIGERLEEECIRKDLYHEMRGIATRLELEAIDEEKEIEKELMIKDTLLLAARLEEEEVFYEQKKIEEKKAALANLEADLAEKQAAAVAAIAAAKEAIDKAAISDNEQTQSIVETIKEAEMIDELAAIKCKDGMDKEMTASEENQDDRAADSNDESCAADPTNFIQEKQKKPSNEVAEDAEDNSVPETQETIFSASTKNPRNKRKRSKANIAKKVKSAIRSKGRKNKRSDWAVSAQPFMRDIPSDDVDDIEEDGDANSVDANVSTMLSVRDTYRNS